MSDFKLQLSEEALKLDPNSVYALQITEPMSAARMHDLMVDLRECHSTIGIRFVVLDSHLKIVRQPPPPTEPCSLCETQAGYSYCAHCGRDLRKV